MNSSIVTCHFKIKRKILKEKLLFWDLFAFPCHFIHCFSNAHILSLSFLMIPVLSLGEMQYVQYSAKM